MANIPRSHTSNQQYNRGQDSNVQLQQEINQLSKKVRQLEAALEAFKAKYNAHDDHPPANFPNYAA